ncbi:MAG: hypothetical protein KKB50_15375 [Planctomycetes bacterium]|nr:hypothetical protein [Planctomycetota bacterium]
MKLAIRLLLPLGIAWSVAAADEPIAVKAWFTDAQIKNSVRLPAPPDALPVEVGSAGDGIDLQRAVAIENPLLQRVGGYICFWIRPKWRGDDRQNHRILWIGEPQCNGLLVEKAATGMLRFVMASPEGVTAARADVSHWKAGEWHHVAIAWFSKDDKPLGLPLWIDRVAVAGPIAGYCRFLDPKSMGDARVWIGHESSAAVMDELVFRRRLDAEGPERLKAVVYRDYFRTAPYTAIRITPEALRVPSDRRVVAGHEKQFGLQAETAGKLEFITDYVVRYGQWGYFDAKPMIGWRTSDEAIATVDENGMVTGQAVGRCQLTAEFRGMSDTYEVEVIPIEQPDLVLQYVERLPRYEVDRIKNMPEPGDAVESVVHIENFGYKDVPAGTGVRFELLPDRDRNYRLDADEQPVVREETTIDAALPPRDRRELRFKWLWPAEPVWVRVTLDPADRIAEICEANNQRCELNIARAMKWAYDDSRLQEWYNERQINHVGSFCHFDWINAQCARFNLMLRETIGPTTTPHGIEDALRSDMFFASIEGAKWHDQPWEKANKWYDGGFPVREPVNHMAIDAAILHEFGHTCVALPDLYGYPVRAASVFLKDEQGNDYADTPLLPRVQDVMLPLPSAMNVPCGGGYSSLMDGCHLWLHPAHAGEIQHFRGFRGQRFWGVQGRLIPIREHIVQVFDVDDQPLPRAAVYIYHAAQTKAGDAGTKYFADRPKFMGHTDEDGAFRIPKVTDENWDDPETDEVEGALPVWNPFGGAFRGDDYPLYDIAFTPNVWRVEGLLLLKIVSGKQVEFASLGLTEFNEAFYRGETTRGVFPIRTSLRPSPGETPLIRKPIPEAIRTKNLPPVAVTDEEVTVEVGERFKLDGSRSTDPEGQPLIYRWGARSGALPTRDGYEAIHECTAPKEPGEYEYRLWVIDGVRTSESVKVKVRVIEKDKPPAETNP